MFWRNRLDGLTPYKTPFPHKQENTLPPTKTIQIHFLKKNSPEVLLTTLPFPQEITFHAQVTMTPHMASNVMIQVADEPDTLSLYESPKIPVFNKLTLTGMPASFSADWHPDLIEILTSCFFEKKFDTLKSGINAYETDQKKLSESEQTGQLTLWSYGATYSMDKDPCQVAQTHFYPLYLNKEIKLRYRRSDETLLSIVERGDVIIALPHSPYQYQSKTCARMTQNVIQITFTKIGGEHADNH